MVANNYFDHTSPTYGGPADMVNEAGISGYYVGENIAGGANNVIAVVLWMNSEGHRSNILNPEYNATGLGVVEGSQYGKIYVQIFMKM